MSRQMKVNIYCQISLLKIKRLKQKVNGFDEKCIRNVKIKNVKVTFMKNLFGLIKTEKFGGTKQIWNMMIE